MEASTSTPIRLPASSKVSFAKSALLLTSIMSGAMLGLALPYLVTGDAMMVAAKSALLATGGVTVSYVVNRLAVERGAPLAVAGYGWAALVSSVSILTVGGGLFSATYAGLAYNDVEQLSIEAHGEALSGFVSERAAAAAQSAGIVPAVNAVVSDLTQKRACEILASCISGAGSGGNGPVARLLTEKLGKAEALAQQVERGEAIRRQALDRINTLHSEYQSALSGGASTEEKRRAMRGIDLNMRQAVSDLDEAIPVPLLVAYGEELKAGAEIEGRPDVSRKLTGILRQHGQAITDIARKLPQRVQAAPAFPKQTGVSDTFAYIGHFLPIAAIAGVVELVFPISLWLYTLFALSWEAYRIAPPAPRPSHPEDEFYRVLLPGPESGRRKDELPAVTHEPADEEQRPRRTPGRRPSSLNGRRPNGTH